MDLSGLVTPTFITFKDATGRIWEALALIAPLRSEDMEPTQIALMQDVGLKATDFRVVKKD